MTSSWNCSQESNKPAGIAQNNGLVPIRRQAIMEIDDGLVHLYIYASLGLNELMNNCANDKHWLIKHIDMLERYKNNKSKENKAMGIFNGTPMSTKKDKKSQCDGDKNIHGR